MQQTTQPHVKQVRGVLEPAPKVKLATAAWIPEHPAAIFILCHGHAEHSGRYTYLINTIVGHGLAFYTLDHRGHGRSSGTRALSVRFDDFVDDLDLVVDRARADFPGLPVVLFGHSMGGLIAVRYALAHPRKISLLVTSGPALIIEESTPLVVAGLGKLARIAPTAPVPRDDEDRLNTDPQIKREFARDHRTYHGSTRIRTAWEMLVAGEDARARLSHLTMPLLAMHGENDTLTKPRGTELLHANASSADKTIRLWPGMKHEIFNEPDHAEVMQVLLDWLDARLGDENEHQARLFVSSCCTSSQPTPPRHPE